MGNTLRILIVTDSTNNILEDVKKATFVIGDLPIPIKTGVSYDIDVVSGRFTIDGSSRIYIGLKCTDIKVDSDGVWLVILESIKKEVAEILTDVFGDLQIVGIIPGFPERNPITDGKSWSCNLKLSDDEFDVKVFTKLLHVGDCFSTIVQ